MNSANHPRSYCRGRTLALAVIGTGSLLARAAHGAPAEPAEQAQRTEHPAAHVGNATMASGPAKPLSGIHSDALRVTVDPNIDDADLLQRWIEDRNSDIARHLDHPNHDQWISADVSGALYEYRVTITGYRDGKILAATKEPTVCDCNSETLLALIDDEIAQTIVLLQWTPAATPKPKPPPQRPPTPPPEPRAQLTKLGAGGVASSVLGAITTVSGAALILAGTSTTDYADFIMHDYKPLGYAALTVGGMGLMAGASMVAIDLTRCKRRPDAPACVSRPSSHIPRSSPLLSRHTAGLSLTGRF